MPRAPKKCGHNGCTERVTARAYCDQHTAMHQQRANTASRGYGWEHRQASEHARRNMAAGTPCSRCGQPMQPGDRLHLDHTDDRTGYRGLSHARCDARAGGKARTRVMTRTSTAALAQAAGMTAPCPVTLVAGPPCAGKNYYVRQHAQPDDLIVDYDALMIALTGDTTHQHSDTIAPFVFDARDAVLYRLWRPDHHVNHAWIILSAPTIAERYRYEWAGAKVVLVTASRDTLQRRARAERPPQWSQFIDNWLDRYQACIDDVVVVTDSDYGASTSPTPGGRRPQGGA